MKIDLFELIDGLIEGTLHVFYNLLGTGWTVLASPIAGPAALDAKRAAARTGTAEGPAEKRQMGGATFLFLCFLAVIVANALLPWGTTTLDALAGIVRAPGEVDIAPIWPAILGAMAATAIVDVALRIASYLFVASEPATARNEAVNRAEYALLWPLLALAAIIGLVLLIVLWLRGDFPAWLWVVLFAALALALAASVPIVLQFRPELRGVFAKPWKQPVRFIYRVPALALLQMLLAKSLILGLSIAASLHAGTDAGPTPAPGPAVHAGPPASH